MSKKNVTEIFTMTLAFASEKERTDFINENEKILRPGEDGGPFRIATEDICQIGESTGNGCENCEECENRELCWGEGEEEGEEIDSVLEKTKEALKDCDGNVRDAANYLGVAPSTVYRRINRFGIDVEEYR